MQVAGENSGNGRVVITNLDVPPTLTKPVLSYTVAEGQTLQGLYGQLLANAQDADPAAALTISAIGQSSTAGFLYPDLADQLLTYTADGYNAAKPGDSFTYTVSDGHGGTVTGTVDVTVTGASLKTQVGTAGADTLTANGAGQRLIGGDGNDTLRGNGANQLVFGGRGDDTITVNGAGSVVYGGLGTNAVTPHGAGQSVVLQQGGTDQITGFNLKTDTLDLAQVLAEAQKSFSTGDFQVTDAGNNATLSYVGSPSFTGGNALATLVGVGPGVTLATLTGDHALITS